jgi:2'-5' RNA ligase
MQSTPVYMPHVSLMYGDIKKEEKEKLIPFITIPFHSFAVHKVHLYRTTGEVESWHKRYEFIFKKE